MKLRLTRTGWLVLVLAAAAAVAARSLRYPELTVAAVALAGAVVFGGVWALVANRPATATRQLLSERVTDGERASGTVTVTGRGRRSAPATMIDAVDGKPVPTSWGDTDGSAPGSAPVLWLPALPRGRYRLGPVVLVTTDPLGLARTERRAGGEATLWVHPVVHEVRPHGASGGRRPGLHLQAGAPHGIELHRLDDYVPGDDPRLIHWPTSLRRGNLMVRHPARDRQGDVLVVLDTSGPAYRDDEQFEHAVRTAASIVLALAPEHETVRLATTGGLDATIGSAGRRRVEVLDALAAVRRRHGDAGLAPFRPGTPHRLSLVAVTGDGGGDREGTDDIGAVVTRLSRHVEGLTVLRLGESGALARSRPRGGPAYEVLSAPTSIELLDAWMTRTAP